MPLNAAMDLFFNIIQQEAIYLETIVSIYTSTLLTVNVVLICIISYYVLCNVRSVFPLCQHCTVGSCLVNSLPMSTLKKIHKFYLRSERSMALIQDETEQKRVLEQDSANEDSESEAPHSTRSTEEPATAHPLERSREQRSISFAPPRGRARHLNGLHSSIAVSRQQEQSPTVANGERVPSTQQTTSNVDRSDRIPLIASLTRHNLNKYASTEAGSLRSLFSHSRSGAESERASGSLPQARKAGMPIVSDGQGGSESSPREERMGQGGSAVDGLENGPELQLSSSFASFCSEYEDPPLQGDMCEPAALDLEGAGTGGGIVSADDLSCVGDRDGEGSVRPGGSESDGREEHGSSQRRPDELSQVVSVARHLPALGPGPSEPELCLLSESGYAPDAVRLWFEISTQALQRTYLRQFEALRATLLDVGQSAPVRYLSGASAESDYSSNAVSFWCDMSSLALRERRKLNLRQLAEHRPPPATGTRPREPSPSPSPWTPAAPSGSGIFRVAGALRSMLKKTALGMPMAPRHAYKAPAAAAPSVGGGGPGDESFEDHVRGAAAAQLAWYFRTSVYTLILSLVLAFCFCVWLVPQTVIHQLINTGLLTRCSRFASVGVSKTLFLVRELVLADGFSRMGPAAITANAKQSLDDLTSAISCFRLGEVLRRSLMSAGCLLRSR